MGSDRLLFSRALTAFLLLPGVVAFLVPLAWLRPAGRSISIGGSVLAAIGGAVLLACVREFYVAGRGTLAPWSPPKHLVVSGLYRLSRNPMYVGVLILLIGWAVGFRSMALLSYAAIVAVMFHARILTHEEPWLAQAFGVEWEKYRATTSRWLGVPRRRAEGSGAG
jgi:protein-S-isoprenylcysteine O-methyltransferase Ste14